MRLGRAAQRTPEAIRQRRGVAHQNLVGVDGSDVRIDHLPRRGGERPGLEHRSREVEDRLRLEDPGGRQTAGARFLIHVVVAAPAHVRLVANNYNIVRRDTDLEQSQQSAVGSVKFAKPIREVQRYVKAPPVSRNRQACGNLRLAPWRVRGRQRNRECRAHLPIGRDLKGILSVVLYAIAIVATVWSPPLACAICVLVAPTPIVAVPDCAV